jgi:fructan beta-fructosidase
MRIFILLMLVAASVQVALADPAPYAEPYRPQLHFSPPRQWMNDPNGLVYYQHEYHLFYQFNPDANVWGPMHWGHAVSRDSVHWKNLPIALYPDRHGVIFSGSVVADLSNTSGLGTRAKPPLVAMFTYHDHGREDLKLPGFESQGLAFSLDAGRTWEKYFDNPVLASPDSRDFRDPKVVWHEQSRRWIVALSAGDHVAFYSSSDLRHWSHESDFGLGLGAHDGVWECPDLIRMKIENSGEEKFLLLVSIGDGGPNGGTGTQYFVGDFDGHHFTIDAPSAGAAKTRWLDYGTDNYAGSTWSHASSKYRPPRFIGWMSNWQYATVVPTERWRSAMTLPRELRLVRTPHGIEVRALPVPELRSLRRRHIRFPAQEALTTLDLTRAADESSHLFEINLDLDLRAAGQTALVFANDRGEQTVFRVDMQKRLYELDRSQSGTVNFHAGFGRSQSAPAPQLREHLTLRIFLDQSSLEIFINEGETVLTTLVFPTEPYHHVTLKSTSAVRLHSADVYVLESIWKH